MVASIIRGEFRLRRDSFELDARFEIPASGFTMLTGVSGSGKTSLLRCLAGLETARGRLTVGEEVWQDSRTVVPAHERRVGYVFQDPVLFPHLSVRENLLLSPDVDREAFDGIVSQFKIKNLLFREPVGLSGGERRRVAIARALLLKPKLLLLDEPLSGLDHQGRLELLGILEALPTLRPVPVIFVTHSLSEMIRLGTWLVVLAQGRVVKSEKIDAIRSRLVEIEALERSLGLDLLQR